MKNSMKKGIVGLGLLALASSALAATKDESLAAIQKLERLLDARNQVQIQMQTQINQMGDELNQLRGQIEKNSYQIQQVLNRQRELYSEMDKLSTKLDSAKQAPAGKANTPLAPIETYSSNTDENAAYEHAVSLIRKDRNYNEAIRELKAFLVQYPSSTYKPNAHYWLGQLYYSIKKDMPKAESNFKAVIAQRDSSKRADSLLKLGLMAEKAKDKIKAKQYYQNVLQDYPKSSSAERAKKQLDAL